MSSLDEKTLDEVAKEYDIPRGTLYHLIQGELRGFVPCPFPVRKFAGKWLIDTGSDEFKAYADFYAKQYVVIARREGRLKRGQGFKKR